MTTKMIKRITINDYIKQNPICKHKHRINFVFIICLILQAGFDRKAVKISSKNK